MDQAVSIVVGFVLTTLIGGWWATRLQNRSWEHQNERRKHEEESRRASEACDDLSRLLDKRLYRMRRLYWSIAAANRSPEDVEAMEARLDDYNSVLYEWNDRLNANLALLGSHFGTAARAYLFDLYERFREVGRKLEFGVTAVRRRESLPTDFTSLDGEFEGWSEATLNGRVYVLGAALTAQLRDGLVGSRAPARASMPDLAPSASTAE